MSRAISRRNEKRIGQITNFTPTPETIGAASSNDTYATCNIPGTGTDDCVIVTAQTPTASVFYEGYVSAPGVITLRAFNLTGNTLTPTSTVMQVQVLKR